MQVANREAKHMKFRTGQATLGLFIVVALSGCGGGSSIESVIPSARAEPVSQVRAAPPDPAYLQQLISSNPIGREGGAISRTNSPSAEGAAEGMVKVQAFAPSGWSYHIPTSCSAANVGGLTYIYMSFADGTYIYSADTNYASILSAACVGSSLVAVYITANYGSFALWSNIFIYR